MFQNFKSYKNETIFDMRAENMKEFEEAVITDKNGEKLLPVSVIYGPNAGGKSGLIEAFMCFISLVLKPRMLLKKQEGKKDTFYFGNEVKPYKLDDNSSKQPTKFQVYFSTNQCEYRYQLSVLNEKIMHESLYKKEFKAKKPAKIFEREGKQITLGEILRKTNSSSNVNDNMPYLTFLSITNQIAIIVDVIEWFEKIIAINYARESWEDNPAICKEETKKLFFDFMRGMDIDIQDYRMEEREGEPDTRKLFVKHQNYQKEYELDFCDESEGTKKLFNLIPYIIEAIRRGGLVILDELDAKLHPKLLKYIIHIFKNRELNEKNAQLIFTSQDLTTMNPEVFRRDEIWFACKNERKESEIYSLYEIRDENGEHIRANAPFYKQYLAGKYGADPYLSKMLNWEE